MQLTDSISRFNLIACLALKKGVNVELGLDKNVSESGNVFLLGRSFCSIIIIFVKLITWPANSSLRHLTAIVGQMRGFFAIKKYNQVLHSR
jgi:hypothetical protein